MNITDVLTPIGLTEFLQDYVGKNYAVMKGDSSRFCKLVTWQDLNEALSRLRVHDKRVHLIRRAKSIPIDEYVRTSATGKVQYLDGAALTRHVSSGATLVVNQVDELFPGVRKLVESCEDVFKVYVSANLYAGWRRDQGFDVHWDAHDTLIVQVIGTKDWTVWEPTRLHPLAGEARTMSVPSKSPAWSETLIEGQVLYMPRGWWHIARPRDEPSLHLTLALNHPNGADLLRWAVDRMTSFVEVRAPIPHWRSDAETAEWMQSVREVCMACLTDDAPVEFMRSIAARAHPRPIVRLPQTANEAISPRVDGQTRLRLEAGSSLPLRRDRDTKAVSFEVKDTTWRCHEGLAPALSMLNHNRPTTLAEMGAVIVDEARSQLRPFILSLIGAKIVWAETVSSAPAACDPVQ